MLNRVTKFNLFVCFFSFLFLNNPWKIFHSIHLFYFSYSLATCIKEGCKCLSSKLLFATLNKTLKYKKKNKSMKKCILQQSTDLNSKRLPLGLHHGANPRSHWTNQTVKKLNLWGKTAVDRGAWIKAWVLQ